MAAGSTHLTNEEIRKKKFINNFDLVNYAIRLAENMIETGREPRVKSEIQNRAMLVVEEILEGKDCFDDSSAMSASDTVLEGASDLLVSQSLGDGEESDRQKLRGEAFHQVEE